MLSIARCRIGICSLPKVIKLKPKYNQNLVRVLHQKRDWFDDYAEDRPRRQRRTGRDNFFPSRSIEKPKWSEIRLEEIDRNLYQEHNRVLERDEEEVLQFYKTHHITVKGGVCPKPILNFDELTLSGPLTSEIAKQNWDVPTPIQSVCWPLALSGRDMVGISRTGSGKTAGYLIPAMAQIKNQPGLNRGDGPICLVLVPTRELSRQVGSVASTFGRNLGIRHASVYGGDGKHYQIGQMQKGVEICLATPGRLIDLLESGVTNLHRTSYLVIDEADRMLDMGFEPQIRRILDNIRPDRQTLMWSATWPSEVQALAHDFLNDFVHVKIGSLDLQSNQNIEQIVQVCLRKEKYTILTQMLQKIREETGGKSLIFTSTKRHADVLCDRLQQDGFSANAIHGDKTQKIRDLNMKDFRSGRRNIMVATDVASRGIDVSDIKFVINYDFPNNIEDYVHRIGRTARGENTGVAFTLFTPDDASYLSDLIKTLKEAKQDINHDLLDMLDQYREQRKSSRSRGRSSRHERQYRNDGYY